MSSRALPASLAHPSSAYLEEGTTSRIVCYSRISVRIRRAHLLFRLPSLDKKPTTGETKSGWLLLRTGVVTKSLLSDLKHVNPLLGPAQAVSVKQYHVKRFTYHTVAVNPDPANGAMQLTRMLYFSPSKARVRVRPMIPAFAAAYCERNVK